MHKRLVRECFDHEECEVDPSGSVARKDRVADVATPHRQALALTFFEIAPAHDCPAPIACEDPVRRLDLIIKVGKASEATEEPEDLDERS